MVQKDAGKGHSAGIFFLELTDRRWTKITSSWLCFTWVLLYSVCQNLNMNSAPLGLSDLTEICPLCKRMICLAKLNPIPEPLVLVV